MEWSHNSRTMKKSFAVSRVYHWRILLAVIGACLLFFSLPGVCGSAFAQSPVGGGGPTVVRDASTGDQWLYYVGADREVWAWVWDGHWSNSSLGGEPAAAATSPTVVRDASTGDQWLYYLGADGKVWAWVWNGSSWSNSSLGGEPAAAATSPTAVRDAATGDQWLYYVGADGKVWAWVWDGHWSNSSLGGEPAAAATSPTVTQPPPPPPPVETTPVPTPVPRPASPHTLRVKVVFSWTWRYRITRLDKLRIGTFPRHMRFRLRCLGRGCPRVAIASAAGGQQIRRMMRAWEGTRFRAGDRLRVTLTAPGYLPERAAFLMRSGKEPRVKLL